MDPKLLTGFLELLILETLSAGPSYGYAITQEVLSRSGSRFELKEGSLYPALHRLEREKLLKSSWGEGDGRQRKYYEITSAGGKLWITRRANGPSSQPGSTECWACGGRPETCRMICLWTCQKRCRRRCESLMAAMTLRRQSRDPARTGGSPAMCGPAGTAGRGAGGASQRRTDLEASPPAFWRPARVAWRLWWDANWEKLMSQRITNILLAVLIVACLGLGFLTWRSMTLYRVAIEQARAESMRAQAQAEQMLLTLKEQAENSRKAAAPSEWNQVALELRYDSPTGDLVEGASVTIAGISPNTKSIPRQELKSGPDGLADFGPLLFGEYALQVKLPNEAVLVRKIGVRPGKEFRETIVCPLQATKPVSIAIEDLPLPAEWAIPEEIRQRVWYRVVLSQGQKSNTFEGLLKADQPRGAGEHRQPLGPLDVWEAPLVESHGENYYSVFRRPDGSWVYPGSPLKEVPNLNPESLRFRNWKPGPQSFLSIGDRLAAGKGEQLPIPLGYYGLWDVATYIEVEQVDGAKCLAGISSDIDHPLTINPRRLSSYPSVLASQEIEFALPQASLQSLEVYRQRQVESISVDPDSPSSEVMLSISPSASLSLAARSKLPPGTILSQVVAMVPATETGVNYESVDFFSSVRKLVDIIDNAEIVRDIARRVPVIANRPVLEKGQSTRDPPQYAYEWLLVGLTLEQVDVVSEHLVDSVSRNDFPDRFKSELLKSPQSLPLKTLPPLQQTSAAQFPSCCLSRSRW